MPFDETLAGRLRPLFRGKYSVKEKRMFGGLAFMINGHMCWDIVGKDLVVRTGRDGFGQALRRPHARPMDFTGRPMKGFVYFARRSLGPRLEIMNMPRTRFRLGSTTKIGI